MSARFGQSSRFVVLWSSLLPSRRRGVTFWAKNRFRVFYDVNVAEQQVLVLAIGVKEGNRLLIGGKEFQT
jgi:hypothetical protein